jgi:hypothetical protein
MSNAMSRSKSRWKAGLLAGATIAVISPLAANAQSMTVGLYANPLGGGTSPNVYSGTNNVYIDPFDTDTLYVYGTVMGTQAPSATYVDGFNYAYFNVNAITSGTASSLGSITAAIPTSMFGGGNFNGTSGNPLAGAQTGTVVPGVYNSAGGVVVGSATDITQVAKPRSAGDIFVSSTVNSGSNIVVSGNSVSFLLETLTYTPNQNSSAGAFSSTPGAGGTINKVAFNVSTPSAAILAAGNYQGSNYFVGLPTTPALGVSPGLSNTSQGYSAVSTSTTLTAAEAGDANLDGIVNGSDVALLAPRFNLATTGYHNGDFNNDGIVNGSDVALLAPNFNLAIGPSPTGVVSDVPLTAQDSALLAEYSTAAVPEPASMTLFALGAFGVLARRRVKI